ncbi:PDZ domain-containing protein, partial [bacterium]|nr:PDZ domain-containing protein [candidate division CSSED10-310 bacterium]
LTSKPSGVPVYIDNEARGRTPLQLDKICPGKHRIRVDLGSYSGWSETVDIEEEKICKIHAFPRPTLIFLGCAGPDLNLADDATRRIDDWFKQTGLFNMPDDDTAGKIRVKPSVAALKEMLVTVAGEEPMPWEDILETLPASIPEVDSRLMAVAEIGDPREDIPGSLYFFHTGQLKPDRIPFAPGLPAEKIPDNIVKTIDAIPSIARLWLGMTLIDYNGRIMIIEIDNDGPAVFTNTKPGDFLTHFNGVQINTYVELKKLLEDTRISETVQITVKHSSESKTYTLRCQWSPIMYPIQDTNFLYNYALAWLEERSFLPATRTAALLNIGICYLALNDPKNALSKGFSLIESLDDKGITKDTLNYLIALTYKKMGYREQSEDYLKKIPKDTNARVIDINGPMLHPLLSSDL